MNNFNFLDFIFAGVSTRRSVEQNELSGRGHGRKDTILSDFEPENLNILVRRSESLVIPSSSPSVLRTRGLWQLAFREPMVNTLKKRGNKPIHIHESRMELLILLTSTLGAQLLTSQMESDEIRGMVLGSFAELQTKNEKDSFFGLPYKGDHRVVFFRKSWRVLLTSLGDWESLTPLFSNIRPSEAMQADLIAVLDSLYGLRSGKQTYNDAEDLAFLTAFRMAEYGQILRMQELSDDDFIDE